MTQGGLKAMEELAKLEAERGTAGYEFADRKAKNSGAEAAGGLSRGRLMDGPGDCGQQER